MKITKSESEQYGKLMMIMIDSTSVPGGLKYLCNYAEAGCEIAFKITESMLRDLNLPSAKIKDVMGQVGVLRQLAMISGGVGLAQAKEIQELERQFGEAT